MQSKHFLRAAILAIILITSFVAYWEYYWRSKNYQLAFNDDKILWATARRELKSYEGVSTVITGGSRIKFDIDIDTWEKLTGEKVFQLAIVGTPARLILRNLANDESFKGKLIVDVTEGQFFGLDTIRTELFGRDAIEYYRNETPAQRVSSHLNLFLESKLLFLEESRFGLNNLLNEIKLKNRPGVTPYTMLFRKEYTMTNDRRQTFLTPVFLSNPSFQSAHLKHQAKRLAALDARTPPVKPGAYDYLFKEIGEYVGRIRLRGGSVLFVRPPSSGDYVVREKRLYPRSEYWDRLLKETNTPGIHFADYPSTAAFNCPEHSHLTPDDAIRYTEQLIKIIRDEQGWFNGKNDSQQPGKP